jgi:hypothetical protein
MTGADGFAPACGLAPPLAGAAVALAAEAELEMVETAEVDDSGRSFFPSFSGNLATGASFDFTRRVYFSAGDGSMRGYCADPLASPR